MKVKRIICEYEDGSIESVPVNNMTINEAEIKKFNYSFDFSGLAKAGFTYEQIDELAKHRFFENLFSGPFDNFVKFEYDHSEKVIRVSFMLCSLRGDQQCTK